MRGLNFNLDLVTLAAVERERERERVYFYTNKNLSTRLCASIVSACCILFCGYGLNNRIRLDCKQRDVGFVLF